MLGQLFMSQSSKAFEVQTLESAKGIEYWLVESHTLPLVTVKFSFKQGSVRDAAGKEGTAYLLSGLLDEGAGDMTSEAFQQALEETQVKMSFDAGLDQFTGTIKTLSDNLTDAENLASLALNKPRFDEEPVERVRQQILASIRSSQFDPNTIAGKEWFRSAYEDHVYARPVKGSIESVEAITSQDLKDIHNSVFRQEGLSLSIVGAISKERAGELVDAIFGSLPKEADYVSVPIVEPKVLSEPVHVELDVPQTVIRFGRPAILRDDPDFIPAFIMNHILGGGSFTSWLYEEVRENRGLAYSVYSFLYPLDHSGILMGGVATEQARAQTSIDVIQEQINKMAEEGPSQTELDEAKTYLKGSYPLRFDTSSKIAGQLTGLKSQGLSTDYITDRAALIDAVTIEDIKRAAKRIVDDAKLTIITVGKSE